MTVQEHQKIINIFARIKDDVIENSVVMMDADGIRRKVIDPLDVVEIINERLDEVEE